ncbi:ubiquinone/menaquinone biosynthesis C-methylase UbiE [Kribbella aluminosa]|uniref:Ubiquinone/menaquinone biosynthesis C-methylase UbiE n=1 Tax=Kribbella aluminosa TaxID=416017 RepID=A0ABS4UBM7_9ACTN|nr:class I SAM-dependent methyltransferase [Kribbella aluminosa]MBP2348984.1 ubiquinone/menaquinone biosynthesis C-methylase UbiE [Kribbella aluminosa]
MTHPDQSSDQRARWRRYWDKHAQGYDKEMAFWDRVAFGDSREWVCSQATGQVLEVAIGTGLNLGFYPDTVTLTGIDFSPAMLDIAAARAAQLGRTVTLRQADAQDLPYGDAWFDTVVCTFGLCAIPDPVRAIDEMRRVLRPGGRLLLADHVASTSLAVRALQRAGEVVSVPYGGEHFLRRPLDHVRAAGFEVENSQRFKLGIVERLCARKPGKA